MGLMSVVTALIAFQNSGSTQAILLGGIAALSCVLILMNLRFVRISPWIVFWLFWLIGQSLWTESDDANVKLGLAVAIASVICGMAMAQVRTNGNQYKYLAVAASIVCIVCVGFGFLRPEIAITSADYEQGSLNGIYVHRNIMGFVASLSFVLVAALRSENLITRRLGAFLLISPLLAVLWAQSRTAWIATLFGIGVLLLVRTSKTSAAASRKRTILFVLLSAICISAIMAEKVLDSIFGVLGRDSTLTGRTVIWKAVINELETVWFAGVGWGVPWRDGEPLTEHVWAAIGFESGHAHNSYLDLMVQVGIVGTLLTVGLLLQILFTNLRASRNPGNPSSRITLALLSVVVVRSLTESVFHLSFVAFLLGFWSVLAVRPKQKPAEYDNREPRKRRQIP